LLAVTFKHDAERHLGFLIHDLARLLRRTFDRRLQDLGLTQVQWRAIAHLSRSEGMTQSALADSLEVQPITLARLVDRMELAGWIERRSHPLDRRATQLYLTDKCQPILAEIQTRAAASNGSSSNRCNESRRTSSPPTARRATRKPVKGRTQMSDADRPNSSAAANPPAAAPALAPPVAPTPAAVPPRRRIVRSVLLILGPLAVVVVGAYVYFTSGRFVETDNAYVKADVAIVSAQIAGPIATVAVRENQRVQQGEVLFTVDDRPFQVSRDRAMAQLGAINDLVESFRASYRQTTEQLALARTNALYEEREYERLSSLADRKLASEIDVDEARHKRDVAKQEIAVTERALDQIRARLGGDLDRPVTEQSAYLAAKSTLDAAALDIEHTVVRAPFNGIASKVPTLGQYVAPGAPIMSVVADRNMWIEANYKETDLTHVAVGQGVEVTLDTYPDRTWRGTVDSISQATGSEFSVIPAQNATGNWVKVTQRIPVRIAVEMRRDDPELRVGMSAIVAIDTGYERPAPSFVRALLPNRPGFAAAASARDGQ
jgi:membrane fusion protein (multidrug efflux system)